MRGCEKDCTHPLYYLQTCIPADVELSTCNAQFPHKVAQLRPITVFLNSYPDDSLVNAPQ
jgi:hypothetical protein